MADADSKEIVKSNKEIMDETAKQLPALQSIAKSAASLASNSETPEDRRERLRNENKPGKAGSTDTKSGKTGGFLSMIKGLGAGIGGIASTFMKFGGFLLKAAFFPITAISAMLTSTAALVAGLVAIAALFVGVGVASFMLTDDEFDKLKVKIAEGVAGVFSKIVEGAVGIYNSFVPDSFKVSEDDKKKMGTATFTAVKDTIVGIIDFAKEIVDAFGEGFSKNMKGIKLKFESFTSKIGELLEVVKGWMTSVGEKTGGKSTLMGIVSFLGDALGTFISGILSVANFIADLIIDPQVTLAKLQVSAESLFMDIGRDISDIFGELFSKEAMTKFLHRAFPMMAKGMEKFGLIDSMEEVSKQAAKRKKEEEKILKSRQVILAVSAKETERQLKEEQAKGKKRNDEKVRNLALVLEREKKEITRNEMSLKRVTDGIAESKKTILDTRVNKKLGEEQLKLEKENRQLAADIANMQRGTYQKFVQGSGFQESEMLTKKGTKGLLEDDIKTRVSDLGIFGQKSSQGISFSMEEYKKMLAVITNREGVTEKDLLGGKVQLSTDTIRQLVRMNPEMDEDTFKNGKDLAKIVKAANQRSLAVEKLNAEIAEKQAKINSTTLLLAKRRKEIELEQIKKDPSLVDDIQKAYLPNSGQRLNQLERDKNSQSNGGGTVITNTDASAKTSITHVYNQSGPPNAAAVDGRGFKTQ